MRASIKKRILTQVKEEPERFSLMYVPHNFVAPGGRFREFYYWDAYWIIKVTPIHSSLGKFDSASKRNISGPPSVWNVRDIARNDLQLRQYCGTVWLHSEWRSHLLSSTIPTSSFYRDGLRLLRGQNNFVNVTDD